jgi:hypothetical protein
LVLAGAGAAAIAEETSPADAISAEPSTIDPYATALSLSVQQGEVPRFAWDAPVEAFTGGAPARIELELAAGGAGSPVDVAIAQRASLGANGDGIVNRRTSGSELRVGRGLIERRESPGAGSVYAFVASDDEALTWQPGARNDFGGHAGALSLQNQVQVGDMSAGLTYERSGVQASLAYVEREESTRVGQQTFSQDQSFTGVTVTMRR